MSKFCAGARVVRPQDGFPAPDCHSTLCEFFSAVTLDTEPPQKKRRVLKEPILPPNGDVMDHSSIALVAESLRFNLDHESYSSFNELEHQKIPVQLENVTAPQDPTDRLYLTLRSARGHTVDLSFSSSDIHGIIPDVHQASKLGPRKQPGSKLTASDVAWSECFLESPQRHDREWILTVKIKWRTDVAAADFRSRNNWLQNLFSGYIPPSNADQPQTSWTPQDFYSNVHVPSKHEDERDFLGIDNLECELYPFQKRAVSWLLRREGVHGDSDGRICALPPHGNVVPLSFEARIDEEGQECFISHVRQEVRTHLHGLDGHLNLKGGILAEEMGLGKTVELIALILLHRRQSELEPFVRDDYTETLVRPSGATLIITPPAILEQWKNELSDHAPSLRVSHYQGMKTSSKVNDRDLTDHLLQQDVVLTTYGVLSNEIYYANEKPNKNLRNVKKYKPRRSPLVQISWWRVCLDEAQMIESGVSNAATVARLIPRCNAWAVSGTPLKNNVKDLLGLLIFLRYAPFCQPDVWDRMLRGHRHLLAEIFGQIALRHTKSALRDELVLPPQKRIVITVPFSAVEEQNYKDLFRQMCDECGMDSSGAPLLEDFDPNEPALVEKMRSWLTRLRQTCLHAEIGGRNRRALGSKGWQMRTVDEVLEVMIDQNETALRSQERSVLTSKVLRGQILSFGKKAQPALDLYLEALNEANTIVTECRGALEEERRKRMEYKAETGSANVKVVEEDDMEGTSDEENAEEHTKGRVNTWRLRLRSALEMQHVCYFFAGTGYYQVKEDSTLTEPESEKHGELEKQESDSYEQAKAIRKELLSGVTRKAKRLMDKVSFAKSHNLKPLPSIEHFENARGLESRKVVETVEKLRAMLNEQAQHFEEYRSKLIDLLLLKLIDHDEDMEMTGDEYEASTKHQDEQYVLLEALRCVLADRNCMITGQTNLLINHEMKQALKLATKGTRDAPEQKGPAPELMESILTARKEFNPPENITVPPPGKHVPPSVSLRSVITDIRSMITSIQWHGSERSRMESKILEAELANLQDISKVQLKRLEELEKELDLLRSTMNQRLEFYRQLQLISDTVAPLQEEASEDVDETRFAKQLDKENNSLDKLSSLKTKRRYLSHVRCNSADDEHQKMCIICRSPFDIGVLTVCGHQYCQDCIVAWWTERRTCPMCKYPLKLNDFHKVTYQPKEIRAQEEQPTTAPEDDRASPASSALKSSIYSDVGATTLNEIKSIDLPSSQSYGVKIDTIARHLLWIRQHDPGSKSIIFSQYRDFLQVLGHALASYKIGCTEIGSKNSVKRFREDPSIECFLLHAKAESSGLTLVNATHVFLCEPLINPAIELQAIARVHRIGQRRPTTVWMYLVSDTVEEAIYDISVSRRLAHIQNSDSTAPSRQRSRAVTPALDDGKAVEENKLDAANSLVLQTAPISKLLTKGQSGGEVVQSDDLWQCLFSKPPRGGQASQLETDGPAGREMGTFLRAEAAEGRRNAELAQ